MTELPPLPEGFKLDQPDPVSVPPLPEGFTLDGTGAPAEKSSWLAEAGKGIASGAVNVVGTAMKGLAAPLGYDPNEEQRVSDLQKELPTVVDMSDEQFNDFMKRAMDASRNGGVPRRMIANARLLRDGKITVDQLQNSVDLLPDQYMKDVPLYQAGEKVQEFSREKFSPSEDYQGSWTRAITEGLGSTLPFLLTAPLGPATGATLGTALGSATSAGEAIDMAVQAGATTDQIMEAVKKGLYPGLTEQIPIETLFDRIPLPVAGKFANAVGRVLAQAAEEGGQEAVQQTWQNLIAKYEYNPDQEIGEGVAQAAGIGAIVGGGLRVGTEGVGAVFGKSAPMEQDQDGAGVEAQAPLSQEAVERVLPAAPAGQPGTGSDAVSPPVASESPAVSAEERAMLNAAGNADDMIDAMSREEIEAELLKARQAAIEPSQEQIAAAMAYDAAQRPNASPENDMGPPVQPMPQVPQTGRNIPTQPMRQVPVTGTREAPQTVTTAADVEQAGQQVNTEPTEAQKVAGNYKKAHLKVNGLDITIENPAGSERRGISPDGEQWRTLMPAAYGYVKRSTGADGDQVDVYVGDNPQSDRVFVVNQKDPKTGKFDEHKALIGFNTINEAARTYYGGFSDGSGPSRMDGIVTMSTEEFKRWLKEAKQDAPVQPMKQEPVTGPNIPAAEPVAIPEQKPLPETDKPKEVKPRQKVERFTEEGFPALKSGAIRRPESLAAFLTRAGGLQDQTGELSVMDAGTYRLADAGPLVRKNGGQELDRAREAAEQAGYLPEGSTVRDLLDALDEDLRGNAVYSSEDQRQAAAYEAEQGQARSDEMEAEAETIYDQLMEMGYPGERGDEFMRDIAQRMLVDGDPVTLEEALLAAENKEFLDSLETTGYYDTLEETFDAADQNTRGRAETRETPRTPRQPGEGRGQESAPETGGEAVPVGGEVRPATAQEGSGKPDGERAGQSTEERQPEEVGAEGKPQLVIPGAEKIPDKQLAERKAEGRKKATVEQKEPGGLFSDEKDQDVLFSPAKRTDTEAFRKWFGNSKVVDENGEPLVVYHGRDGATDGIADFDTGPRSGYNGRKQAGAFFSANQDYAASYAGDSSVVPAYLSIQNPFLTSEFPAGFDAARMAELQAQGYDGLIWNDPEFGDFIEIIAFDPTQIKSVYNEGTWSSSDPRILKAPSKLDAKTTTDIRNIVMRVGGIEPEMVERINVPGGITRWGDDTLTEAAGVYDPSTDAITVSLSSGDRDTAYHEAFHRLQQLFLNPQEQAILSNSTEQLRQIVALGSDYANMAPTMDQIELEAEAFAVWSRQMDQGNPNGVRLHIAIRRAWMKIRTMIERVKNLLRGRGYQSLEDVFGRAYSGEIVDRETSVEPSTDARYSIAQRLPAGAKPKEVPKALVTGRLKKALLAGVRSFKNMEGGKDRQTMDDGETFSEIMHRKWVDYLHPVYMMQERSKAKLTELNDIYLNARLAEDTALSAIQTMHDTYVTPMVEKLRSAGASLEDLHSYLYALHAPERNRVVGLRNPEDSDLYKAVTDPTVKGASGMSDNEARAVIADLKKNPEAFKAIRDAATDVHQMLKASLKRDKAAGLISAETYDLLTNQWKLYVPLKGREGMDEEGNWRPRSTGFDVRGDEFKQALGRFSEADNIIANAIAQSEEQILRHEKNNVGKAALRFVNQVDPKGESIAQVYWAGEDGLGDIQKVDDVYQRVMGADGKVTLRKKPNPFSQKDDVLAAKVGGKTYYIRFKDQKVGLALRKMNTAQIAGVVKLIRKVSVWQSIVNTRANPAFTPINIIRDVQTGAVHMLDEGYSAKEIAGVVGNIPKAWKAIWNLSRNPEASSEWDKWAKEYFDNGGKITFHGYTSMEENLKKLQADVSAHVSGQGRAKAVAKGLWKFIEDLNDAGENGIRLAAYVAGRKKHGLTPKEAAFMARDLTVDFKKHGEWGPTANSFYVFFNAALQGNYNIARRMARSNKVKAAIGGFMFAGMMQHVWNSLFAGDDDDGENAYYSILRNEPYRVERQFVFFIPGTTDYVSFPLPYGFNAFYHLGVQGGAMASGVRKAPEGLVDSVRVAFDAFNPIGSGSLVNMISPTIGDPIVELWGNKNFFGGPIYPEAVPFDAAPPPNSSRHWSSTNPYMVGFAEFLNDWTGGNSIEPGAIDWYPDAIEHVFGFFTGGLGRFGANIVETADRTVKGEFEPEKTPWLRSFYGQMDEDNQRTEYFRERELALEADGYLKDYAGGKESDDYQAFLKNRAVELEAAPAFKAAEKQRRKLTKMRRAIEDAPNMSKAEREAALKDIEQSELKIMRAARQAFEQARRNHQ